MNYYTHAVSDDWLECSREDYEKLQGLLEGSKDEDGDLDHGVRIIWHPEGGEILLENDDNNSFNLELLTSETLQCIGEILKKAGQETWGIGVAFTADRTVPGAFGGSSARFLDTGALEFQYEDYPSDRQRWLDEEHPEYTRAEWRAAVAMDHTVLGYSEWVDHEIEEELEDTVQEEREDEKNEAEE